MDNKLIEESSDNSWLVDHYHGEVLKTTLNDFAKNKIVHTQLNRRNQ